MKCELLRNGRFVTAGLYLTYLKKVDQGSGPPQFEVGFHLIYDGAGLFFFAS